MVRGIDTGKAQPEKEPQTQSGWLFRLARPLAFLLAVVFSIWAIYTYYATAQLVLHDPGLVLPQNDQWTVAQLESALTGLRLPGNFYAIFALSIALVWNLTFLACGWLILLRKSRDWFGLYLALLLLSWTNGIQTFVSIPPVISLLQTLETYLAWIMWPGLFLLFYIFPNGHVTPRWARWFAWILGLLAAYGLVITSLGIQPTSFIFALPLIFAVLIVGGYAQVFRYRHTSALERQQIKWVVLALMLLATGFIILSILENLTGLGDPRQSGLTSAIIFRLIAFAIGNLTFIFLPVSIAMSVLRYRLWDVDIIIRRTLVYGVMTATLALAFFGGVTLLQQVVGRITGTENSPVAIAISTLLIAALFSPLRRRIQDFIDRRFYRQKYNAEQALEAFASAARDEADIEHLSAELLAVVQETMQPEQVSLWLKVQENRRS